MGVGACVALALVPYQDMLHLTKDSICGGETAFIYAYGGAGLPLWSVLGTPKNSSSSGQWEAGTWKARETSQQQKYRFLRKKCSADRNMGRMGAKSDTSS